MVENKVVVTGVFHQCKVKYGIKPEISPCQELEGIEQRKKGKDGREFVISFFECVGCGHRVAFSYREVE